MAEVRPFAAVRPREDLADKIAALPYDVYNRAEAKAKVQGDNYSFLRIDRAESQLPDDVDTYDERVYAKAKELLYSMIEDGSFVTEAKPCYYVYELTMDGRKQAGIVACSSIDDYQSGVIKKHENTRADKEQDRINHVDTLSAQTGPIFLAYKAQAVIDALVERVKMDKPLYSFTADDGIMHEVWVIDRPEDVDTIRQTFAGMNEIYIADGHHRAASAVKVGFKRRAENPAHTGEEEYNFFLSVLFPDKQLKILDYNRVVKDTNGLTDDEFLKKLEESFTVELSDEAVSPDAKGVFGLFISGKWYKLSLKEGLRPDDPVKGLDVSVLQELVLGPVLGIGDPRTDSRIDFVGGIRGLKELERRAGSDMKLAFSMYPTSIDELFAVADAGLLMPPKSTWFEPKLRSGLFIHRF